MIATLFLAGCGVQGPPQPPRVETPAQIKDLRAVQIGDDLYLNFSLPQLATDGEQLTKPLEFEIFRTVTPPGQKVEPPSTNVPPWATILPHQLARYEKQGKIHYTTSLSEQVFRQEQNSTFSFTVVALTRSVRGRRHPSAPSNVAMTQLIDASEPVTNVTVKTTQAALEFSWTEPAQTLAGLPVSHIDAYRIYQSRTGEPSSFRLLAETRSTRYNDPNFQFGRAYYFQVSTVSSAGGYEAESAPSQTLEITPKDTFPPAVPKRLTALYAAGAVDLLWNANTDSDLAGYNVYRKTANGQFERLNKQLVSTPIYHDASVVKNRVYQYAVTAVDLSGNESAQSQPATVSTHLPGQPGPEPRTK